jgi:hypothetical protein
LVEVADFRKYKVLEATRPNDPELIACLWAMEIKAVMSRLSSQHR